MPELPRLICDRRQRKWGAGGHVHSNQGAPPAELKPAVSWYHASRVSTFILPHSDSPASGRAINYCRTVRPASAAAQAGRNRGTGGGQRLEGACCVDPPVAKRPRPSPKPWQQPCYVRTERGLGKDIKAQAAAPIGIALQMCTALRAKLGQLLVRDSRASVFVHAHGGLQ